MAVHHQSAYYRPGSVYVDTPQLYSGYYISTYHEPVSGDDDKYGAAYWDTDYLENFWGDIPDGAYTKTDNTYTKLSAIREAGSYATLYYKVSPYSYGRMVRKHYWYYQIWESIIGWRTNSGNATFIINCMLPQSSIVKTLSNTWIRSQDTEFSFEISCDDPSVYLKTLSAIVITKSDYLISAAITGVLTGKTTAKITVKVPRNADERERIIGVYSANGNVRTYLCYVLQAGNPYRLLTSDYAIVEFDTSKYLEYVCKATTRQTPPMRGHGTSVVDLEEVVLTEVYDLPETIINAGYKNVISEASISNRDGRLVFENNSSAEKPIIYGRVRLSDPTNGWIEMTCCSLVSNATFDFKLGVKGGALKFALGDTVPFNYVKSYSITSGAKKYIKSVKQLGYNSSGNPIIQIDVPAVSNMFHPNVEKYEDYVLGFLPDVNNSYDEIIFSPCFIPRSKAIFLYKRSKPKHLFKVDYSDYQNPNYIPHYAFFDEESGHEVFCWDDALSAWVKKRVVFGIRGTGSTIESCGENFVFPEGCFYYLRGISKGPNYASDFNLYYIQHGESNGFSGWPRDVIKISDLDLNNNIGSVVLRLRCALDNTHNVGISINSVSISVNPRKSSITLKETPSIKDSDFPTTIVFARYDKSLPSIVKEVFGYGVYFNLSSYKLTESLSDRFVEWNTWTIRPAYPLIDIYKVAIDGDFAEIKTSGGWERFIETSRNDTGADRELTVRFTGVNSVIIQNDIAQITMTQPATLESSSGQDLEVVSDDEFTIPEEDE